MDLVFAPSQIETWPIGRLRPYARNAKIHDDDQVAKIAASMAKFGWTVPCMVADDGELIAGHGRVLAATMLGLKDVPVIRLGHLDEAERRAYRIADNKLTELGDWDAAMLRNEIAGLLAEDFDLSLLGITDADLDANPGLVKTMSVQPPRGSGHIRLVRIGQGDDTADLQPCGGTHVANTAEIGTVRIGKIEKKGKQNRRVYLHLVD